MKKTLIALTVAALPMAAAQADSGNVTIYGQANASMDFINANSATQSDRLNRVSSNASRLGFKGTEDMGNGLSAVWQIEQQVALDSGSAANMTSRNAFVGLSGKSWGTFLLGTHDTPYKLGTASLDIFADTMGDYNAIIGAVSGTSASSKRDLRLGNVAAYISPTVSGFHAAIATSMVNESGNGGGKNASAWTATGIYENGPIFASLSYETQTSGDTTATSADSYDTKGTKLGVGYNFGDAKVGFIYEHLTDSRASNSGNRNAYGLNVAYTMGANVLKAAYLKANDGDGSTDTSAKNFTIGVDHNMSKRTAVYALYTKTTNSTDAIYNIGTGAGGAYTPAAGEDPSAVSIGIKHSF